MLARKTVLAVVVTSIVVTTVHYADNIVNISEYPQPGWISREVVLLAWVLFTLIGVAAYLLYRAGRPVAAGLYLLVYSITGLSSPGHYLHGSFDEFSLKMHAGIGADALVGLAVAACGVLVLLRRARTPAD